MAKRTPDQQAAFEITVRAMRKAQKDYFDHRRREDLIRSKQLEKKIDTYLGQSTQGNLFANNRWKDE